MAQWEFYGRVAASRKLARLLAIDPAQQGDEPRFFAATGIGGRRGVGKNTLLEHVVAQHGWADRLLVVRLPAEVSDARKPAAFLTSMHRALRRAGMMPLLNDLPDSGLDAEDRLAQIIEHLVRQDIIVCLDEVHAIIGTIMPTVLQELIDNLTPCTVPLAKRAPGQLVLMGSHQQKFGQLQGVGEPLHDRFHVLPLRPWSITTVMDIARQHGWDRRPGRLHTLWTAYDGMPREWERFAQSRDTPQDLREWEPLSGDPARDYDADQAWRRAFVQHERHVLDLQPRRRWNNRAYVELAPAVRDAIIWMGQNRAPGQVIPGRDIISGVGRAARANRITLDPSLPSLGDLNDRLAALDQDTGIVCQRHHFIGRIPGFVRPCWSLNDNTTLFQLRCAPDLFPPRYRPATTPPKEIDDMVRALETLEGTALERLTAGWLRGHPHVRESYSGAEPAGPQGQSQPDIDVLARLKQKATDRGPQDLLVLGNAKRDSSEHDVAEFRRVVDNFMTRGRLEKDEPEYSPEIARVCQLPRTLIFVAPVFQPADRERIQAAGHLAFDVNDMAVELRTGWPLLHECLDRARQAASDQDIRLIAPAAPGKTGPETESKTDLPEP